MAFLEGKQSANTAVYLNMADVSVLTVTGSGSAFSINATMSAEPGTSIVIKDGYTSKGDAITALEAFLSSNGIERMI